MNKKLKKAIERGDGHPLKEFPSDLSAMKALKTFYLKGDLDTRARMQSQVQKLPPEVFIMMWLEGNQGRDVARDGAWV